MAETERDEFPAYEHTQRGPLCLILYGVAMVQAAVPLLAPDVDGLRWLWVLSALVAVLALSFHHLTVADRGERLSIRFGPLPLLGRSVRYDEIEAVEVDRTSLLDGWGIHWSTRGGWVWNLWGRDCVLLRLRENRRLWVGTDDAENLARHLQGRIRAQPV